MFLMFSSCSIFGDFFLTVCPLLFLLSVVSLGKQLDASKNAMGGAGAKAFGDMLLGNKTIQTLDVSDNSFGKVQKRDKVKHNTSGSVCTVNYVDDEGTYIGVEGDIKSGYVGKDFEWESQILAFCAGVAASPSLISVSTTFRHALLE